MYIKLIFSNTSAHHYDLIELIEHIIEKDIHKNMDALP